MHRPDGRTSVKGDCPWQAICHRPGGYASPHPTDSHRPHFSPYFSGGDPHAEVQKIVSRFFICESWNPGLLSSSYQSLIWAMNQFWYQDDNTTPLLYFHKE